jgi:hypothetical protein
MIFFSWEGFLGVFIASFHVTGAAKRLSRLFSVKNPAPNRRDSARRSQPCPPWGWQTGVSHPKRCSPSKIVKNNKPEKRKGHSTVTLNVPLPNELRNVLSFKEESAGKSPQ